LLRQKVQFAAVAVSIRSQEIEDRGVGIVVVRNPMTLLVPLHLVVALEDDPTAHVMIDGIAYEKVSLRSSPELERDELALIRVGGKRKGWIGSIRIPRHEVRLRPGQPIAIGAAPTSENPVRTGTIVEVRERTLGTTVVTDVEVKPGDSGSAVLVNRELVAVCQGMLPQETGGVAIAMPLSTSTLGHLWSLRRRSFLHRGLPAIASLAIALGLTLLGVLSGPSAVFEPHNMPSLSQPAALMNWRQPATELPLWPQLFDPTVNGQDSPASSAPAQVSQTQIGGRSYPTLEWLSDGANPVQVSYALEHPQGEGATALALTLSSSQNMDVRIWGIWEGDDRDESRHPPEASQVVEVTPVPTRFVLPYDSFATDTPAIHPDPHEKPDRDSFTGFILQLEASSGMIRFYGLELVDLAPMDSTEAEFTHAYLPIDGFSEGTIPINWWYAPRQEDDRMVFENVRTMRTDEGTPFIRFHYTPQNSMGTIVLQLHDTLRPVDLSAFDGIEIRARADGYAECELELGYLDPGLPTPPGELRYWPGTAFAYPNHPLLLTRSIAAHRVAFEDLYLDAGVLARYPNASDVFTPSSLVEVKLTPQDKDGTIEILAVQLYREPE